MWVFLGGLAFTAVGGWGMYQAWRLNRIGERVSGVVVALHWESAGRHGQTCHPVVEFRTVDGRVVRTSTRGRQQPGSRRAR